MVNSATCTAYAPKRFQAKRCANTVVLPSAGVTRTRKPAFRHLFLITSDNSPLSPAAANSVEYICALINFGEAVSLGFLRYCHAVGKRSIEARIIFSPVIASRSEKYHA